ncbi:protein kinase domain-containing protein [Agaribacter flavus]|uniref:Protein kinase n=1 Tax=Agaribacter flavus TaxID=1902781 RepID=A0ABV7FN69_9ALTE
MVKNQLAVGHRLSALPTHIGQYEIIELIHIGERERIFKARPCAGSAAFGHYEFVAIKQAKTSNDAHSNSTMTLQVDALKQVQSTDASKHFIKLIDEGRDDNQVAFFVMPFYQHTLTQYLQKADAPVDAELLLKWLVGLCNALSTLHKKAMRHGDIKPDNLFVDDDCTILVGDLGSASKSDTNGKKADTKAYGSPSYSSPEVLSHQKWPSKEDDFYSMGKTAEYVVNAKKINIPTEFHQFINRLVDENLDTRLREADKILSALETVSLHLQQSRTQVLSNDWLIATYQDLYQAIRAQLLTEGVLFPADEKRLLLRHLPASENKENHQVYTSLVDCAYAHLQEDESTRDWLIWCKVLHEHLQQQQYQLNEQALLRLQQEGVVQTQRSPVFIESYLRKHINVSKSKRRIWLWVACLFFGIASFYFFSQSKQDSLPLSESEAHSRETVISPIDNTAVPLATDKIMNGQATTQSQSSTKSDRIIVPKTLPVGESTHSSQSVATQTIFSKRLYPNNDKNSPLYIDMIKINGEQGTLWVMQNEVSRTLYEACVKAGKCRKNKRFSTLSDDPAVLEKLPVTQVSWHDIVEDFIPYANHVYGAEFTLPSLAQWQLFSNSAQGLSDTPRLEKMHCKDCNSFLSRQFQSRSMPVDALPMATNKLRHVWGNVQEWLSDCPSTETGEALCYQALVVGGSWMHKESDILTGSIDSLQKRARSINTGFRLVESEK